MDATPLCQVDDDDRVYSATSMASLVTSSKSCKWTPVGFDPALPRSTPATHLHAHDQKPDCSRSLSRRTTASATVISSMGGDCTVTLPSPAGQSASRVPINASYTAGSTTVTTSLSVDIYVPQSVSITLDDSTLNAFQDRSVITR